MSTIPSLALPDTVIPPKKPRYTVKRKSTIKSKSIQTAVTVRRLDGQSKVQIAKDLGIAQNTVTSILALNSVEEQIAEARKGTIALAPLAIAAVQQQIEKGDGDLGYKVLTGIGAIGEDAIDTIRRNSRRQSSAINVLVQPGATVNVNTMGSDTPSKHNVHLADATTTGSDSTNDNSNANVGETGKGLAPGKQPRRGSGQ